MNTEYPTDFLTKIKIKSIEINDKWIVFTLNSQHQLHVNHSRISLNERTSLKQRLDWKITENAYGVYWPAIASQDSVEHGQLNIIDILWETICELALDKASTANWVLKDLALEDQQIVSLWRLEADNYNGGFLQFFCNWGEANCQLAIQTLKLIGAKNTFDIVTKMRAVLDRLDGDPRVTDLNDLFKLLTPAERNELNRLDEAFWEDPDKLPFLAIINFGERCLGQLSKEQI